MTTINWNKDRFSSKFDTFNYKQKSFKELIGAGSSGTELTSAQTIQLFTKSNEAVDLRNELRHHPSLVHRSIQFLNNRLGPIKMHATTQTLLSIATLFPDDKNSTMQLLYYLGVSGCPSVASQQCPVIHLSTVFLSRSSIVLLLWWIPLHPTSLHGVH